MNEQTKQALEMAIEALENVFGKGKNAIIALKACKEALAQPAPSWQGLSDEEKKKIWFKVEHENGSFILCGGKLTDAIEQALKEKNS